MKSLKQKVFIGSTLVALSAIMAFLGNACSAFQGSGSNSGSVSGLCADGVEFEVNEGEATVSVVYGTQVIDNMVACTGLESPSAKTMDEFTNRSSSLSEYGSALDVNPPMMMGIAAIAIEVCDDLVAQERGLASVDRRIFNPVSLDGSSSIDQASAYEVLRRMSRSCLGRDETSVEASIVWENVSEIINGGNPGEETNRHAAISICTGVLASLDGIRQ